MMKRNSKVYASSNGWVCFLPKNHHGWLRVEKPTWAEAIATVLEWCKL